MVVESTDALLTYRDILELKMLNVNMMCPQNNNTNCSIVPLGILPLLPTTTSSTGSPAHATSRQSSRSDTHSMFFVGARDDQDSSQPHATPHDIAMRYSDAEPGEFVFPFDPSLESTQPIVNEAIVKAHADPIMDATVVAPPFPLPPCAYIQPREENRTMADPAQLSLADLTPSFFSLPPPPTFSSSSSSPLFPFAPQRQAPQTARPKTNQPQHGLLYQALHPSDLTARPSSPPTKRTISGSPVVRPVKS